MKNNKDQERPTNPFESGVMVARLAASDTKETAKEPTQRHKGGKARAKALSAKKRSGIAKKAAMKRWEKK